MDRVEQAVKRVEAYIEQNKERFDVDTYYTCGCADEAITRLYLKPKDEATIPAAEVMKRVSEGLPEIIIGTPSFQFDEQPGGATSFSLQLAGESTERLAEISHEVARRLSSVAGSRGRALRGRHRRGGSADRRQSRSRRRSSG